jgi:hypothetical protein
MQEGVNRWSDVSVLPHEDYSDDEMGETGTGSADGGWRDSDMRKGFPNWSDVLPPWEDDWGEIGETGTGSADGGSGNSEEHEMQEDDESDQGNHAASPESFIYAITSKLAKRLDGKVVEVFSVSVGDRKTIDICYDKRGRRYYDVQEPSTSITTDIVAPEILEVVRNDSLFYAAV